MPITKIPIVTQFVLKQFAKKSARKSEGIATLLKASDPVVKSNVKNIEIILKNMGIDPKNLTSTDDVLNAMNYHKAMVDQHLKKHFQKLDLGGGWTGIKSLEKKQPFQGFNPRVQQDVDNIIKDLKNMEPVAAMKEANLIIGRKGKYKNLSGDESQRILKETDDHIFQRDIQYDEFGDPIKPDPEDMASGGRIGYAGGQLVKGARWFLKSLKDTKRQLAQLDLPIEKKTELLKQADDAIRHIEGGGPIPEQIIQHIRKDPKFRSVSQGPRSADPDLAEMEEVILEYGQRHASGGLAYMLGEPNTRTEALREFGVVTDPWGMYTDPSLYAKGERPSGAPQRAPYSQGGVGHGPWTMGIVAATPDQGQDETPVPQVASKPNPLKAPRGLPSVAPKNMDPAYIQQQMMQQAMMARGPRPMAAEGGIIRAAFKNGGKMSRRGFLKLMAGLAALPVVGKYFKAAKLAKPAAAVTETIVKSNAPGMPAWFPSLVKRVIKEGKDETEKLATIERQTVHTAKTPEGTPIQVTRDLTTDDIVVDIGEQTKHGWSAGRHGQPVRLELKKGEWIEPSTEGGGYMTKGGENVYPGMSKGFRESEEVITKPGKSSPSIKSKDEFTVQEAEFTGGHPENVKFEETVDFNYGDHGSDFSEIEQYATKGPVTSGSSHGEVQRALRREGWHGKKEQARQLAMDKKYGGLKSTYKKDPHVRGKQADLDDWAEGRAEAAADEIYPHFDDEFAQGGLAYLLGE